MAESPEEFAYSLSRTTFDGQVQTETKLRERAAGLLQAASVVMPVAGIAISKGPSGVVIPFGLAAISYAVCAYFCGIALIPKEIEVGIAGGSFLDDARDSDADLLQMYATAASYLDQAREANSGAVSGAAEHVKTAIGWLVTELALIAISLVVTVLG